MSGNSMLCRSSSRTRMAKPSSISVTVTSRSWSASEASSLLLLTCMNKYDPDTGLGVPGDYEAPLIPTIPGDYTFHLTGKVHDTTVDETATSSDSTFNSAVEATDIQFPTKVPSLTEITTRLDRLDARVAAAASAPPAAAAASAPPDTSATDAASAASATAAQARRFRFDRTPRGHRAWRTRRRPRGGQSVLGDPASPPQRRVAGR